MKASELLRNAVEIATPQLTAVTEAASECPRAEGHWSPKQIVGHLTDSACNNHARFVRAQFGDDLVFPGYDQEAWVSAQPYDKSTWLDLLALWRNYNLHLARVIDAIPDEVLSRERVRHNLNEIAWRTVPEAQSATLDYFVRDYIGHLEHQLLQILPHYEPVSFDRVSQGGAG